MFKRSAKDCLRRFILWMKREYTLHFGDKRVVKPHTTISSAGKVMSSVFWDSQGIIVTDCRTEGR